MPVNYVLLYTPVFYIYAESTKKLQRGLNYFGTFRKTCRGITNLRHGISQLYQCQRSLPYAVMYDLLCRTEGTAQRAPRASPLYVYQGYERHNRAGPPVPVVASCRLTSRTSANAPYVPLLTSLHGHTPNWRGRDDHHHCRSKDYAGPIVEFTNSNWIPHRTRQLGTYIYIGKVLSRGRARSYSNAYYVIKRG